MRQLQNALDMSMYNKQYMEDIGLQNKLSVLLNGLFSKSLIIQYIATFLKKNIYCIDSKTIKTKSDFNDVIKHITTKCSILTFDNVFHERTTMDEPSNVQSMNSTKNDLTLDYILNVFQGDLIKIIY